MKFDRWMALPVAGIAALVIGVAAVNAATPSPTGTGSNYAEVFVNKLAAILHLSPTQTQSDLKQAELQTVDQMVKDGKITKAQADALKGRINSGQGFQFGFPFRRGGGFGNGTLVRDLRAAELNAVAGALHLTPGDLQTQLRSGKTLGDLERSTGVTDSAVRTAEHNAARGVLNGAVKAGTITQAKADAILSRIDQGGGLHGFGARPDSVAPSQEPQAAT